MKLKSMFLSAAAAVTIFASVGPAATSLGENAAEAITLYGNIKKAESSQQITLKVYNVDDYILPDMDAREAERNGYDAEPISGINTRFEEYMKTQGKNVRVQYDTYSTNEDMINQLKTGKIDYDLICTSDYAIQKLMSQNLIIPFDNEEEYPGSTPNYDTYASPFLIDKLSKIKAKDTYHEGDDAEEKDNIVQNFARGYMWGTLGLIYNPTFKKFQDREISEEQVHEDVKDWDILWDEKYKNTAYAKDSIRDTLAAVYIHAFKEEIYDLKDQYEAGKIDADSYNEKLTEIFNRTQQHYLDKEVSDALRDLSTNIYGYEVDNGKDDIQKEMVGIDLAYSGDAVYAMNGADSLQEDNPDAPTLYYSLPEGADNIWFDGWMMTYNAKNHGLTDIAQEYVDFLSNPLPESDNYECGPTIDNMDYIGYTPFIASSPILEYLRESYDIRANDEVENSFSSVPEGVEGEDYLKKDLTYFFEGTLDEGEEAFIYYPVSEKNRQLDAMYPDNSILPRLVVMKDYGDRTTAVNQVWEAGKALQFPIWGYWVTLAVVAVALAGFAFYKIRKKKIQDKRSERMANALLRQDASQTTEKQRREAQKVLDKANKQHSKDDKKNTKTNLPQV